MEEKFMELHEMFKSLEAVYRAKVKEVLDQLQLSGVEYRFLKKLPENERLTISEISQRIEKHNSNTTAIVDNLEKKGYIKRVNDTNDRRIIRIEYTDVGKMNRIKVLDEFAKGICKFLNDVPEDILKQSYVCMKYFIDKLGPTE